MTPPDRLTELRRQRVLHQQHTDWLDREITRATLDAPPEELTCSRSSLNLTLRAAEPLITANPGAILSRYRSD